MERYKGYKNKLKRKLYLDNYRKENREYFRLKSKVWREENPEYHKLYGKMYYKEFTRKGYGKLQT